MNDGVQSNIPNLAIAHLDITLMLEYRDFQII